MPFSQKQQDFFDSASHRWNLKVGATRSGKTYADYFVIPKRIRARVGLPGLCFILGVSRATIERNVLEPMRQIWGEALVGTIKSDNTCYLFGEVVYCLGCEKVSQVAKIRGSSIKYCYGDEVAEWSEEVFELLKSRLDKPYSVFDGSLNPGSPTHWLKGFLDSEADIYAQQYTIFDNPFLPDEVVRNICLEYEGTVYYDRYVLGKWALAEGLIYPMYKYALYSENPLKGAYNAKYEDTCISIDYGTQNAFAALLWQKYHGVWYAVKGYYYSGRDKGIQKTDSDYIADMENFLTEHIKEYKSRSLSGLAEKIQIIIDPSAASFIAALKRTGWAKVRPADNAVLDGIRETAVAIKTGCIKIHESIKEWQDEAAGYVWDAKSTEERPMKERDHYMDATRYFVKTMRLARPKREYPSIFEGGR